MWFVKHPGCQIKMLALYASANRYVSFIPSSHRGTSYPDHIYELTILSGDVSLYVSEQDCCQTTDNSL